MSDVRLIDANALIADFVKYVRTEPHMHYGDWDKMCISGTEIDEVVAHAPTIDAVPVVRGRWQPDMYFNEPVMRCTACKRGFAAWHKAERFLYCPNCGAKMDAKE